MHRVLREIRPRIATTTGDARRLFHGRGHCYAGLEFLTIDFFPPVILLILYREPDPGWLAELTEQLRRLLGAHLACVLAQHRQYPGAPTEILFGHLPSTCVARENGLEYGLRLGEAQNIGFFPDMAVGRQRVRQLAAGRRVLNLFAYTCAFSVAALAGGAARVVNLDMNRGALRQGQRNHRHNGLDAGRAAFLAHDLFKSFAKLRRLGPFDLTIIDPPGDQGKSFRAERDWPKIVSRLPALTVPGSDLILGHSTPHLPPDFLLDLLARLLPGAILLAHLRAGEDFPERDSAKGLHVLHYRLGRPAVSVGSSPGLLRPRGTS